MKYMTLRVKMSEKITVIHDNGTGMRSCFVLPASWNFVLPIYTTTSSFYKKL